MKYLSTFIALIVFTFTLASEAGTYTTNNMGVGTATPSTTPIVIQRLTLFTTNATPTIVYLYDGFYTSTNAGYTNYVTYTTNQITIYTNTAGLTNTFTNTVIATAANAVAANTGAVSVPIVTLVVPPLPGILDFTRDISIANRLTISNTLAGVSGFITYRVP